MKVFKLICLVALILGFGSLTTAKAQIDVTLNPVNLLFGKIDLGADFALNENLSVEPTLGYLSRKIGDLKYTGIPIDVSLKYYFNPENGNDKFYVSGWTKFINRKAKYDDLLSDGSSNFNQTRLGLGFGLGYKIVSKGNFVFDIAVGGGRAIVDKVKYEDDSLTASGTVWNKTMFNGKLGIGYRFGR